MRHLALIIACLACIGRTQAADLVGFRNLTVPDPRHGRELQGAVWYPAAEGGTPTLIGDNPVLVGASVLVDAPIGPGRHPLVLLSHGYSGNWTNQGWLAADLARHGYVAVAVNHPGTTTKDMDATEGMRLWERPKDLSRTIDALAGDPAWSGSLITDRIAAIGHSLGGWTVMELAGGRFDPNRFDASCQAHGELAACTVLRSLRAAGDEASRATLAQPLKDARVAAAVTLDLGGAQTFDPHSLAGVATPVLVVAAGVPNPQIPAALESRYLAAHLPAATTQVVEFSGAAHFSFLPACKPGGAALLAAESPDDIVICRDGDGADRASIHARVSDEVIRFLARALPVSGP